MPKLHEICENFVAIRARIAAACASVGRDPRTVQLIAVSKFQPQSAVLEAIAAGQMLFGENRVQEAAGKFEGLSAQTPQIELHLIGGLQTNKARQACRIASVIESLDRPSLADAIARAVEQGEKLPQLYIQVNTGDEPQKFGIARGEADKFIVDCQKRFKNKLVGLMGIPPVGCDPLPHFRYLEKLAAEHGLKQLSMGMSSDFETAIACGATHIRVGTALFGQRVTRDAPQS